MLTEHAPALDVGVRGKHRGRFRVTAWCLPPGNAARRARKLLRDLLSRPPFVPCEVAELEVVVTELATNAGSYAPSTMSCVSCTTATCRSGPRWPTPAAGSR